MTSETRLGRYEVRIKGGVFSRDFWAIEQKLNRVRIEVNEEEMFWVLESVLEQALQTGEVRRISGV